MRNLILLILGVILLAPAAAGARDVLVVQGLRVKPFDDAFRGLRNACDCDVRRVYLPDLELDDVERMVREERPRLIVAIGSAALERVRRIKDIPVVYLMVLNPPPGRNITGVAMNVPPEKYFDALSRISPVLRRVGVVIDPARSGYLLRRAQQAARSRGFDLIAEEVRRPNDVPRALATLKGGVDALLMLPDTTVVTSETVESFLIFSQNNRVPVISFAAKYVDVGALFALDIDATDQGRQAGEMARQILAGASASALPAAEARKLHFRSNRSVAKKLGIALNRIDQR